MKKSKREQLLATARAMFNAQGFHATGIDALLATSGVSKMTLYKYFPSKDALITEVLAVEHRAIMGRITQAAESAESPLAGAMAAFYVYGEMAELPDFQGCLFASAAAEFKDHAHPAHQQCDAFKREMMRHLAEWAEKAHIPNPAQHGLSCLLLLEGALSLAHSCGDSSLVASAKQTAQAWIDGHNG